MKEILTDGNGACARIAYYFSEVAEIYPITPSSSMAEMVDEWSKIGKFNLFNMPVVVQQLQSEAGVSGALHGSLTAGVLSTTFTSSQGLLLMIPNMYKIAGEFLPCVIHVAARAISTHALSIFADHSDVMATRFTGFAEICSSSVQEAHDMALVSHIASLNSSVPFLHFFDGFRTSHEIQKISAYTDEELKSYVPKQAVENFKANALNPTHPRQQGTAQNPDIYFQNREAGNKIYEKVYDCVCKAMEQVSSLRAKTYKPFMYYGAKEPKYVLVMMGSGANTAIETLKYLPKDYAVISVHLYRPFNSKEFCKLIKPSVKKIAVLDRTKENGSVYEPLCLDVISSLNENGLNIKVFGGRYGLSSKEFLPSDVKAVFNNLKSKDTKNHFTVGIVDDVTHTSLETQKDFFPENNKQFAMKFYGLGGDGTISASKSTIKIIGETTNKKVQGYFEYDSKKSGSLTISNFRISNEEILSSYKVLKADMIAIHNFNFVAKYDILSALKTNGIVLLNTALKVDELNKKLPRHFKKEILEKSAKLFIINAQKIADELSLNNKINLIMQTAFFKVSNIIDLQVATKQIKDYAKVTYAKKGDKTLLANEKSIEIALESVEQVDTSNFTISQEIQDKNIKNDYYENFIKPINSLDGNSLKVSAFSPNGFVPTDTTKFEKRAIASNLPKWESENCIQCGLCTLSCPHSAIRSVLVNEDDLKEKPDGFVTVASYTNKNYRYKIQISPEDCTGCGVCANVCPALKKALVMKNASQLLEKEKINYEFFLKLKNIQNQFSKNTVKGLQFEKPYFEFSAACAGCGETPYIKIATQLFGENMLIANATGCSSIYGGSAPCCPFSKNEKGYGPAWASSLFEDNAEFGFGMSLALMIEKEKIENNIKNLMPKIENETLKSTMQKWLENNNGFSNDEVEEMLKLLQNEKESEQKENIIKSKQFLAKKSVWIIGGDGWAYDIGFGGLDQVLASNQNVNILVLDNEGYSNTGGQLSKSTPRGSQVKFAYAGKKTKKKNLGAYAINTNNCYVASIGLGANPSQTIDAFVEAEAFDGPSLILAYSPCVSHGIDMSKSQLQIKNAVKSGYWNLFRYNPKTKLFKLDSAKPNMEYEDFILSESRYSSLLKKFPDEARELFEKAKIDAQERYQMLVDIKNNLSKKDM